MQKDKVNKIIFLLLISTFSVFITACSNKKTADEICNLKFSWWGGNSRNEYTMEGIKHFHELYPEINIKAEFTDWTTYEHNFEKSLRSKGCADIMQINFDWLSKYSQDGNGFYDLNELADYIELYNYTLDDLSYGMKNGKLNAIPIAFNAAIPVFNKKILDDNNLKIPSTWDELFAVAGTLKKKNIHLLTISYKHLLFLAIAWFEQNYSKKVFSNDGSYRLSEEETELIFDFMKRLTDENVIYPSAIGLELSIVKSQKTAGAFLWCNESSKVLDEFESQGGTAVIGNFITSPEAKESGWYIKPASMYAIKKDCQSPKEAAIFLNYLLNDKDFALMQKNERGVPVSNKSITTLMENNQLQSLQYTALMKLRFNSGAISTMLPIMEDKRVIKVFSDNVFDYVEGRKTRAQAAHSFYTAVKIKKGLPLPKVLY